MNSETQIHRKSKRTTITLEADVADSILDILSKNKKLKEKDLINRLLRKGIKAENVPSQSAFKIEGFKTQIQPNISSDDLEKLLDEI